MYSCFRRPKELLNCLSAGYIFPVGLEPWYSMEFIESDLSFLASDRRSINRIWKGERELGHSTDEKTRGSERKIEICVEGLGWKS